MAGHQPLPHDAFGNYWIFFAERGEKNEGWLGSDQHHQNFISRVRKYWFGSPRASPGSDFTPFAADDELMALLWAWAGLTAQSVRRGF